MIDLTNHCLEKIKANRIPQLDFGENFIFPYYSGYSVANLPASIFQWLEARLDGSMPLREELQTPLSRSFKHVILLVVDSLGLSLFNRLLIQIQEKGEKSLWYPLLDSTVTGALSSITTSTTATVLTSLWTGKQPIEHGVIGYDLWLKEFGVIGNMIAHSLSVTPEETGGLYKIGFDPATFLTVDTIGPQLKRQGIETYAFQHASIADSGLSTMLMKEAACVPWRTYDELWLSVFAILNRAPGKTFTYIYWGDLDTLSHRKGPQHELVWQAWLDFSSLLGQYLIKMKTTSNTKTLFLMTADHGQIDSAINPNYELKNHPQLMNDLVMLPSGEARLPYLFVRLGCEDAVREYIAYSWPGEFAVLPTSTILESKALGDAAPDQAAIDRLGDLIVVPLGSGYLRSTSKENRLLGRHGAFSPEEMLVPFLAIEL